MKEKLTGIGKKVFAVVLILGFIYGSIELVAGVGVFRVLSALYLVLGSMVAWETRQSSGHRLWFLVIFFWLPFILAGLLKGSVSFGDRLAEKAAEEKKRRVENSQ